MIKTVKHSKLLILTLVSLAFVLVVTVLGPFIAPYTSTEVVGVPFEPTSQQHWLGTDYLGRDVVSRIFHGGVSVVVLSILATAVAYLVAIPIGLISGYRRGISDSVISTGIDVLLAVPQILILLVLATAIGAGSVSVVLAVGIGLIPGLARLVRASTLEVAVKSFVASARLRGEGMFKILFRQILPNILPLLMADVGIRFTYAILGIAGASYLGLGLSAPMADWGLMVAENSKGLTLQPLAAIAPAVLVALMTLSINVIADQLSGVKKSRLLTGVEAVK